MDKSDNSKIYWLHLACCGGPLLVFAVITLAPSMVAFVLTHKVWVLAAGAGLVSVAGLAWRRRVRRPASSASTRKPVSVRRPIAVSCEKAICPVIAWLAVLCFAAIVPTAFNGRLFYER